MEDTQKPSFEDACKNFNNAKIYISQGGDINMQDKHGWTLLHHAVEYLDIEWIKFLIKLDADQTIKDKRGRVPARGYHTNKKIYSLLHENIDEPDDRGVTISDVFVGRNNKWMVDYLIKLKPSLQKSP
jgi:ankyrin repeat protein